MTPSPVLVFGATGFTGRMVVKQLAAIGLPVRAAARSQEKLELLAEKHPVEIAVADVADPESVSRAAEGASVLVTTVGPYTGSGHVAAEVAIARRLPYIDVTGEPAWLRRVFEEFGPRAAAAGVAMLPAIGYDYVPGNLAGALALERAGEAATRIDVGYFLTGENKRSRESFSGGTLDSLKASSKAKRFAYRGGRLIEDDGERRVLSFDFGDRERTAVSIGSSEHYLLPRFAPWLEEVNSGLGWFGPEASPAGEDAPDADGPSDAAREQARTHAIAIARDAAGGEMTRVVLDGPNPYDLTGLLVAWTAREAADGRVQGSGAIGPLEAFGLEALRDACADAGLKEV